MVLALAFAWATWQPLRSVSAANDAFALLGQNKVDQARAAALTAHHRDPLSIDPLLELSAVESAAKRPAQARAALEQAVTLQPQNATGWLTLAEYDLGHGDAQKALKELGPALYLDPRSTDGVTLFLQASRQAGQAGKAGQPAAKTPPATATP
jgi:predicted Zn-dependent protease